MLAGYQTQAGVGMSNADRALQAAIAAAEQGNVQWQQQYTTSQDAYQRQLAAAQQAQANVKEPTFKVNIGGQTVELTQSQYLNWMSAFAPKTTTTTSQTEKLQEEAAKRALWELTHPGRTYNQVNAMFESY